MILSLEKLYQESQEIQESIISRSLEDYDAFTNNLLCSKKIINIGVLISDVYSRNVNFSQILNHIILLNYLDYQIAEGLSEKIEVDSNGIRKVIMSKYPNLIIEVTKRDKLRKLKAVLKFIKSLKALISYSVSAYRAKDYKRVEGFVKSSEDKGVILIDNFLQEDSISQKKFIDRYYAYLKEKSSDVYPENAYVAPIYLPKPIKEEVNQICANSKEKLIFIFDFLSLLDYIYAIAYPLFIKRNPQRILHNGYDLSSWTKIEIGNNCGFYFYHALLQERFVKRLKSKGVRIDLYIDWFENQSYDKTLYFAMNLYYPDTPVHAYIGFIGDAKQSPHIYPTNKEMEMGIAPRAIYACCDFIKENIIRSGYQGKVYTAPFFRSQKVWEMPKVKLGLSNVLVPLSLNEDEKNRTLKLILQREPDLDKYHFFVKPHPDDDIKRLKNLTRGFNNVEVVEGSIYEWFEKSSIVLGANSTTLFEALAVGLPVVVVAYSYRNQIIIETLPKSKLINVGSLNELKDALALIESSAFINNQDNEIIRKYFFEPFSIQSVERLFLCK